MTHYERRPGEERVEVGGASVKVAPDLLKIYEDTRNQVRIGPWPARVVVERRTMPEGDFTSEKLVGIAAIELKRDDFAAAVGSDRERFDREIERLKPYRFKCIVVAQDITSVYRQTLVHSAAIIGSIASWYARSDIPTVFIGNDAGAARLIAGLLRRWQERVTAEREGGAAA